MGNNEQNPSERIASHIDELQKNGYYIASVKKNTQPLSARILRHLAYLHEAGVIANNKDEREIWLKYYSKEISEAECLMWDLSKDAHNSFDCDAKKEEECETAIAKNERRLAWMKAHPDTTKTPLELWEDAKRAEEGAK